MKKSEITKLDDIARLKCKELSGYKCVRCGKRSPDPEKLTTGLEWTHIISRSYKSVRWNPKNWLCLCSACHSWAHKFPIESSLWLIKNFGEEWYYGLKRIKIKLFFDEIKKSLETLTEEDVLIPKVHWK